jgi:hypothetical protein
MNASQPSLLLEGVFNGILYSRANPYDRLQISAVIVHNNNGFEKD